jgi:sulfopyruvate decarboxylase subunit beta
MSAQRERMPLVEALAAVRAVRRDDDIVVTTMGTAREWMALGSHPLDIVFVPGCMGHATSLGLGLALARPDRRVIVLNGDGSMLMNLGSLVSITAANPANLAVVVFDNGVYEVTGAQPTPAGDRVDFAAVARACGFQSVFRYSRLGEWTEGLPHILATAGPTFTTLDVAPVPGAKGPRSPGPAGERARRFMAALGRQSSREG